MSELTRLWEPIVINGLRLKNRIVMPPMCSRLSSPRGEVTEQQIRYFRRRAQGGVGLIVVEYAYIDEKASKSAMSQLGVYDDQLIPGLNELAEAIQHAGAKAVLQICHGGRQTIPARIGGMVPVAPSAIPCKFISGLIGEPNHCRELTHEEIDEIVTSFVQASLRVQTAGFDAVELHGAHGYLLASFVSPYTNHRTDRYGGDIYGRAAFPLEVVRRTRQAVGPHFPIFYRMSGDEFIDGGLTLDEARVFARLLEENGVDCVHVSGTNFETIHKQEPPLYIEAGNLLPLAAGVKEAVNIPVIAVGGIHDPIFAEKALADGKADLIAMGRQLLADPDLPLKAKAGSYDSIRPCIRCNHGCIGRFFLGRTQRCSVNFSVGREGDSRFDMDRSWGSGKKMVVIGGGVAGMEAARVASSLGFEVHLFEKQAQLGGNIIPASVAPFKKELRKLLAYYCRSLEKLGVSVNLNQEASIKIIGQLNPDVLVIAAGGDYLRPEIPGIYLPHVKTAIEVLLNPGEIKAPIVIIGGGLVGCEVAVHFGLQGRNAVLVEVLPNVAMDLDPVSRLELLEMLERAGTQVLTHSEVYEISEREVMIRTARKGSTVEAATVILACGRKPRPMQGEEFLPQVPKCIKVGDAVSPGKIGDAIHDAANKVLNLESTPSW